MGKREGKNDTAKKVMGKLDGKNDTAKNDRETRRKK
jgi:hypothetical protein